MDSTQCSAATLAAKCLSYFDKCMLSEALGSSHWIENRRADFNLWVDGVGAMAAKRASLDDRFNSKPRELALVKSLLIDLMSFLRACLSSSEEDMLDEAKKGVNSAIDNLASIAVAIRQTGRRSRLLRADRTFDPNKLREFRDNMSCLVLVQLASLDEGQQKRRREEPGWWQDDINKGLTPLQSRLIEANLRRRNRFLYCQRHSQKLSRREVLDVVFDGHLDLEDFFREDISELDAEWIEFSGPHQHKGRKGKRITAAPTLSGTSASIPESKLRWEKAQNIIQAPKSQITSIANSAIYPKLISPLKPDHASCKEDQGDEQLKVLKCPCCCEALPYTMLKSERVWKKHLSIDLCPYTCIATECDAPHVLYRTRAEWEDHVKKSHASKWKCQLCTNSSSSLFSSNYDLVEHVKETHGDSFPLELISSVRLWPSTPSLGLDKCPLCHSTAAEDSPELINHVLEHTHNFALLSLPWADAPPKQIAEPTIPGMFNLNDSSMLDSWLDDLDIELEIRTSAHWKDMEGLLKDIFISQREPNLDQFNYFSTNDYFADEKEHSRNIGSSQAGSLRISALGSLPDSVSGQNNPIQSMADQQVADDVSAEPSPVLYSDGKIEELVISETAVTDQPPGESFIHQAEVVRGELKASEEVEYATVPPKPIYANSTMPQLGGQIPDPQKLMPCCNCERFVKVWRCVQCDDSFCDNCWPKQRPHREGKVGLDGRPHEKVDEELTHRLEDMKVTYSRDREVAIATESQLPSTTIEPDNRGLSVNNEIGKITSEPSETAEDQPSGRSHGTPFDDDYGYSDQNIAGSELDDDTIIVEANVSALANDSDGWYGQEFGFYSAPGGEGEYKTGMIGTMPDNEVSRMDHSTDVAMKSQSNNPNSEEMELVAAEANKAGKHKLEKQDMGSPSGLAESAFSSSANPDEDWTKISDLAERRRIQNRIAQRNYRKKLKNRLEDLERRAGSSDDADSEKQFQPTTTTKSKRSSESQKTQPITSAKTLPSQPFTPPMEHSDGFFFSNNYDERERSHSPPLFTYSTSPPPHESLLHPYGSPQPYPAMTTTADSHPAPDEISFANSYSGQERPPNDQYVLEEVNQEQAVEDIEETSSAKENLEKIKSEAEIEASKSDEKKAKSVERQLEIEAQIRKDAEEAFQQRMEAMKIAQEEAKREIEKARIEAEDAALKRIEAERNAEEDRARKHAEAMREAEETARIKIEQARKAEEEAKVSAAEKAMDEAEPVLGKQEANKSASAKDEAEKAENMKKMEAKARDEFKQKIEEETTAKLASASKATEQAPIRFKDAVGRKFSFPFHLCAAWSGMEELINQAFMHVDHLGPHVKEGHYDLIGPDGEIILPSVWDKVVQPGWSITMTMWPIDTMPPVEPRTQHGSGTNPIVWPKMVTGHSPGPIPSGSGIPAPTQGYAGPLKKARKSLEHSTWAAFFAGKPPKKKKKPARAGEQVAGEDRAGAGPSGGQAGEGSGSSQPATQGSEQKGVD